MTKSETKLKLSRYFAALKSSYEAELDDLRTDSEGRNILKARLAKKREQVPQLLEMLDFAPEMVAVAFHGAFLFKDTPAIESLITREVSKFPAWSTLQKSIVIEPWAQPLVDTVLAAPTGETFLITTVGLEYLNKCHQPAAQVPAPANKEKLEEDSDASLSSDEYLSDEDETEYDLDQAGADWLAEHGFDRKE